MTARHMSDGALTVQHPCATCEAPGALFQIEDSDRWLCAECAAYPVLVAAFAEGLARLRETAVVDAVVAQHASEERARDSAAMAAARAYRAAHDR